MLEVLRGALTELEPIAAFSSCASSIGGCLTTVTTSTGTAATFCPLKLGSSEGITGGTGGVTPGSIEGIHDRLVEEGDTDRGAVCAVSRPPRGLQLRCRTQASVFTPSI